MARSITGRRMILGTAGLALAALLTVGCSSTPSDPTAPGTSAVLGGSDGSAASSTTIASNSEEGTSGNVGSVSEQRPPAGE